MPKLQVEVEAQLSERLAQFKQLAEAILEEEMSFNDYVALVIDLGLQKMIRDVTPDEEMLQSTLIKMSEVNPGFVAKFMSDVLKVREERQQLGFRLPAKP